MSELTNSNDLAVVEISDYSRFVALKDDWNAILSGRSRPSVFLRHEWFDAAWQWCGQSSNISLLCCYRDTELVAVAPMTLTKVKKTLRTYSEMSIIHVPDTQECDFVVADADAASAVDAILDYLSVRNHWDIVVLPKLQVDSNLFSLAASACESVGVNSLTVASGENHEVCLGGEWSDYYSTRSRRLKKGNNSCHNKISRNFEAVNIDLANKSNTARTDEVFLALKRISSISWKAKTGLTLDNVGPGAFIDRITEHARRNGWLSIWALKFDGDVVAVEYQLIYEGVVLALRADYDPSFASFSPGTYLNWRILENLFSTDNTLYRMGAGSNTYKLRWSNIQTELKDIRFYNSTLMGRSLWIAEARIWPALRRIRKALSEFRERPKTASQPVRHKD